MNNPKSLWWKLTPVAALLTAIAWAVWFPLHFRTDNSSWPLWVWITLGFCLWVPNLYLSAFALWHWKTRYLGKWPFAWAVAFVLWWAVLPALAYFLLHIHRDLAGKGTYAASPIRSDSVWPLPGRYQYVGSVCLVLGLAMMVCSILVASGEAVIYFTLVHALNRAISAGELTGVSKEATSALLIHLWTLKIAFATVYIGVVAGVLGGSLLYASQRIRRVADVGKQET
jgi:hypothetical protein